MDYRPFIEQELGRAALTAERFFGRVTAVTKADRTVLTEADLAIGKQLVEAVRATYPTHNVIDEEAGVIDNGSRFTWVIDPVEATSNFAAGLPDYGVMIGLLDDATPVAGGVIAPAFDTLYVAEKGKGATRNGQPVRATSEEDLSRTLVSFSVDGHPDDPVRTRRECGLLGEITLAVRNTRNNGCEATDTMRVADGRYGGRVNVESKIWDCVAPQIICEEAGALWTSVDGEPIDYSSPLTRTEQNFTFCVAPPVLHRRLQEVIAGRLGS